MAQLKAVDILGELEDGDEPEFEQPTQSEAPPKRSTAAKKDAAKRAGIGKPSPYEADLRAKLRDKVQVNFSDIPRFVGEEFDRLRTEAGMNKKEFFYHLLRERGADIPPYDRMDGRKL